MKSPRFFYVALGVTLVLVLLETLHSSAMAAPIPLIVGTVRDQTGAPVEAARVLARVGPPGGHVSEMSALTDADGTFALAVGDVAAISTVEIRCRFCRTEAVRVGNDGTVVAIVHRYLALANEVPTSSDLANLPYAHTESALALTPFTVLENSSALIPGPSLSDRGIANTGGLVVTAGVPIYDTVASVSPWYFDPARYIEQVDVLPQSDAFQYGDVADGGTYLLDPQTANADASVYAGSVQSMRFGGSNANAFSFGASGSPTDQQRRFDLRTSVPLGDALATIAVAGADATLSPNSYNTLQAGLSSFNFSLEQVRALDVRTNFYSDRASYDAQYHGTPLDETWSDTGAGITLKPAAPLSTSGIVPCATLGVRTSTGTYAAYAFGIPVIGAVITQGQSVFGVSAEGANYHVTAGLGSYAIAYSGGILGVSLPATAQASSPVVRVQLFPSERWSLDTSFSGSFSLPVFIEQFGNDSEYLPAAPGVATLPGTSLLFDHNSTLEGTLEYNDASRLRLGVTALSRNVTGIDQGHIASVGGSFAWQIAPTMSLRTWWLWVTPDLVTTVPVFRFGPAMRPSNAGSAWFTYENSRFLRLDVIWRQDLLDYQPDAHLDASISAPVHADSQQAFVRNLRWFVGSERYEGTRSVDAGLRFSFENQ